MDISFVSLVTTLLFSATAILFLTYILSRISITSKKGFAFFSFIIVIIMLRLFLPFEFPSQNNVNITKIWPDIYIMFVRSRFVFARREWSLLSLLIIISIMGSIICMIRLILSYISISRVLIKYETVKNDTIDELVIRINNESKQSVNFSLVNSPDITTPFIFGFRKPIIVLPQIELSEDEWYYILSHEMTHYYHKDLWLRLACEFLHVVYWWNPLVSLLRKQIIKFQELRTDTTVIQKLDEIQKLDYLQCLVKIAKLQYVHKETWIAAFESESEISKRIKTLLRSSKELPSGKKHRFVNAFIAVIMILITLLLPNFIIFEPCAPVPEEVMKEENAYDINSTNSYLRLNEEGTYDVYVNDEYKGTVTQIFDDSLKIINAQGDIIR